MKKTTSGHRGSSREGAARILLAGTALSVLCLSCPALAQTTSWDGSESTDWFDPDNWNNGVPAPSFTVNIDTIASNPTVVNGGNASANPINIGVHGKGALTVENGGTLASGQGIIGYFSNSEGIVTVTGTGSSWTSTGNLFIGETGKGTLTVAAGGAVSNANGFVGGNNGGKGLVTITGPDSVWTNTSALYVGYLYGTNTGTLIIEDGGKVESVDGYIGDGSSSEGTATVTGAGSTWTNTGDLYVGRAGKGTLTVEDGGDAEADELHVGQSSGSEGKLTVQNGGTVSNRQGFIGYSTNSKGTVTVTGAGSTWTNGNDGLFVGYFGEGTLAVESGGKVVSNWNGYIGAEANSTGTVTVTGPGSTWENGNNLVVGERGNGTLTVQDGGKVSTENGYIGNDAGSEGTATVTGAGSIWTNKTWLYVGREGKGTLTIENGGQVLSEHSIIANEAGSSGEVAVSGAGSKWTNSGNLAVGNSGDAVLAVSGGGAVSNVNAFIGYYAVGSSEVTVDGAGSTWTNSGELNVGIYGSGTLDVTDGGTVSSEDGHIGRYANSVGTVTVTGENSTWTNNDSLHVGNEGTGTLTVENGGEVESAYGFIGVYSTGTATVTGENSIWTSIYLFVGQSGTGSLTVQDGGRVENTNGIIGGNNYGTGTATVTGADSTWINTEGLYVGYNGEGTLTISDGGRVDAVDGVLLAYDPTYSSGTLNIGAASGDVAVAAGTLNTPSVQFGPGIGKIVFNHDESAYDFAASISGGGSVLVENGTTTLTGTNTYTGGTTISGGTLQIGDGGTSGSIVSDITNDAALIFNRSDALTYAGDISGSGSLQKLGGGTTTLTGTNSFTGGTTISAGTLQIGNGGTSGSITGNITNNAALAFNGSDALTFAGDITGTGSLQKLGDETTTLTGANSFTGGTTISGGTLQIGDGGTSGSIAGNITNNAALAFNRSDAVTFAGSISGSGSLQKLGGGTLTLTGANTYTGGTTVNAGTLNVAGSLVSAVTVNNGGTLSGTGTLGAVTVLDGGIIAPGTSPGTITLGSLALTPGSVVNFELDTPGVAGGGINDLIVVSGALTLDGTVNVTALPNFGNGVYTLITYGSVTDNDLELGTMPGGGLGYALHTGTVLPNAVTLSVSGGPVGNLQFWDGAGPHGTGTIDGGNGVWNGANTNWTNETGDTIDAWGGNVAIFGGTAGTVTVEGARGFTGMQFLTTGYQIVPGAGGELVTSLAETNMRVGAGVVATIAAPITGGGGIVKQEGGTLILSGANTYAGLTTISGGTLSIGDGGTSGSIAGDIANNAALAFNRSDALTYAGDISGSGTFEKLGGGTTTLTGTSSFTGGTTISGGTLQIGDGGTSGSIVSDITNDAALIFNRSDALTFAGSISGTGSLQKLGGGTTTLTGTNSFTGGTTISGGTLQIGNGGTSGSITGDITNNAALAFSRSDDITYDGVISGSGALTKQGAGALTLTQDSSAFAGTTTVTGGELVVNGALGGILNMNGGTLGGSGSLGNVILESGARLTPGNSIGTLNVVNYTFNPGSIYEVELDDGGFTAGTNSDLLNATGTVTINGGTVHVTPENGTDDGSTYTPGTYTIITAATGVAGVGFDAVTDDYAFLDFTLDYPTANRVDLISALSVTPATGFCVPGMSLNQCAAGDGAFSMGAGNSVYDAVLTLSNAEAPVALGQLSGEIHASARTALLEDSRFLREAAMDRLRVALGGTAANDSAQIEKRISESFGLWGQGFGSWSQQGSNGNASGMDRSIGGFLMGGDALVWDNMRFGVLGGYARSGFSAGNVLSTGTADTYTLGAYGGGKWDAFALSGGLAHSWHSLDMARSVAFTGFSDNLSVAYSARTLQAWGEAAYSFEAGASRFEPFANLAYVTLSTNSFTETGGAAALTSASNVVDATFATLGLRAETDVAFGDMGARLHGMVGWRHAFGGAPTAQMTFASGGNAFTIVGVPLAQDSLVLNAGIDINLTDKATLGIVYGGQFGSGVQDHSAKVNLNVRF